MNWFWPWHPELEFVKSFTPVRFPKFSILRAKSINRTFLGNKWEWGMFYSFILNKLTVFVPLSTQIQTHSSLEESSLTNFTDRLIFRINSWKIYPSPEILCANVTCDFCENSLFLQFIQHTKYFHTDRGSGKKKKKLCLRWREVWQSCRKGPTEIFSRLWPSLWTEWVGLNGVLSKLCNR